MPIHSILGDGRPGTQHDKVSLRHLHIAENAGISRMPRLKQVLRGVKRTQARSKSKVKERLPITIEILDTLRKFWSDKGSAEAGMLWATASL